MSKNLVSSLIVRADGGSQIGDGHMMRCLALTQAWQDAGGHATFAMALNAPAIKARLEAEEMSVVQMATDVGSADDSMHTINLARELGACWVVVDGYQFGSDYQRAIKNAGLSLLFIDDNGHADHYYANLVLNQNIHAEASLYAQREPYTRLLLGMRYVLLRREFLKWREWKREIPDVARKVLVTLGGGDPDNVTLKVIQALQQMQVDGLEAVVVAGASNPHHHKLEAVAENSRFAIRIDSNVTNMPELMAWADVAVSGGGSTCWELSFMRLPSIVMVLADNQQRIGERLQLHGAAINLGIGANVTASEITGTLNELLTDSAKRSEMARSGQELVDGEGAARVVRGIKSVPLTLRSARAEDCRLVWEWANEPEVRDSAFNSAPILWETHQQWFGRKLLDPNCHIYIALDDQVIPIGQVRFDCVSDKEAEIDITIDKSKRGMGYGSTLIRLAVEELFNQTTFQVVHAFVKPHNSASIRAFERAQFKKFGMEMIRDNTAIHYLRVKNNG